MAQSLSIRRLPGISFAPKVLPVSDQMPRMDIPVFVGFAASGPMDTPVAVEDCTQFENIFGGDLRLATETEEDSRYALLRPTVRSFFANGGRRCWIIRVAGSTARCNKYPLPGLLVADAVVENGKGNTARPAFAEARSEGSWSDGFRVSAVLSVLPLKATLTPSGRRKVLLAIENPEEIRPEDLLRITFQEAGYILFLPDVSVGTEEKTTPTSPPDQLRTIEVSSKGARWFRQTMPASSPPEEFKLRSFTGQVEDHGEINVELKEGPEAGVLRVSCSADYFADSMSVEQGTVLGIRCGDEQGWLTVREASLQEVVSPPGNFLEIIADVLWEEKEWDNCGLLASPEVTYSNLLVEKLEFEVLVKGQSGVPVRLGGLGFASRHPRFWGSVPNDSIFFRGNQLSGHEQLIEEVSKVRFPLAAESSKDLCYLPVGMPTTGGAFLQPVKPTLSPEKREGLEGINTNIFLGCTALHEATSGTLAECQVETLMATADFLRYKASRPQPVLKGIWCALNVEEATMIALPDAVSSCYESAVVSGVVSSPPCDGSDVKLLDDLAEESGCPVDGFFLDCDKPPRLWIKAKTPNSSESFTLSWEVVSGCSFRLQESASCLFTPVEEVYFGKSSSTTLQRGHGLYNYRVRCENKQASGQWSQVVEVTVGPTSKQVWQLNEDKLLAIHRAVIRLCAARGDMTAILSLPQNYREESALAYLKKLRGNYICASPMDKDVPQVPPLSAGEEKALSYAAVFHPWLITAQKRGNSLKTVPPDGAVCGFIAARAMARGAWVAPANQIIRDVVALTAPIAEENRENLASGHINLLACEPRGFTTLTADTLSFDEALHPINVRRLLILIRKMALKKGDEYVFEPNDATFRRLVQRGFESMLDEMFMRGAFSGATPAAAYQVVTDSSINTAQSIEQGRFIVEIKVAPSQPLSFLTIRLQQTSDAVSMQEVY